MPSLMEIVERVNKGELIDPAMLELYQESTNSAEKFLAHHALAMLDLRRAQQHMMQSLEAIDYGDQKVLNQFVSVSGFLGLTDMRCGPIVKFGACAVSRREPTLGIEAIQNAVTYDMQHAGSYTCDRENAMFIASQYERAAQCAGWTCPSSSIDWNNKQTRIAYVCSSIADDDACSRTMMGLAKHHDSKRFKFCVYSTECGVRRDRQAFAQTTYTAPSAKRGATTMDAMSKMKVACWCCPTDCDTTSAAKELANQLVKDKIDVVLFDCTLTDPIACMVAQWECARVKMNLCRRMPMFMSGIQCVSYLDQARFDMDADFWKRKGCDCKFILEGMDLDAELGAAPQRGTYGIPDSAMVLATCGNELDRTMSDEFVETMISVLRAHPNAIYLLIGEGEMTQQKRKFESAGVGKRVGYAGKRKDLPGFLRMIDMYVAEFPSSSPMGVLHAMSMEKPCIAMRWGDSTEQSQAAAFVGSEATISGRDCGAFIERVSKLMREPAYRAKLGKSMRSRVDEHFAYNQTARHIEQMCDQMIQQVSAGAYMPVKLDDLDEPLAQVA